jgi:hypothetical protein
MSDLPESNSRTADGRFIKGCPAGPGRPRKAVRAAADALDERVAAKAGDLFEMAFRQADEGNATALKALLDRVWPIRRHRPLEIAVPEIRKTHDLLPAMAGVTNAMFAGEATSQESEAAARVLRAHFKAIELIDHEDRITVLEEKRRAEN